MPSRSACSVPARSSRPLPSVLAAWPRVPVVLDPVLVATSGASLGDAAVIAAMRSRLFPLARVVTPNLEEAARLGGGPLGNRVSIEKAATTLRGNGPAAWLVKGGHGDGDTAEDCLVDAGGCHWFRRTAHRDARHPRHGLHAVLGDSRPTSDVASTCARRSRSPRTMSAKGSSAPRASMSDAGPAHSIISRAGAS